MASYVALGHGRETYEATAMIRLLIVEPHEILRLGLTSILSKDSEIEIVGLVANAHEALEEMRRVQPDVLLLDDCLDSNLIAQADEAGVGAIVFSNSSDKKDVFEALTTGAKAYILKGSSMTLLIAAIRAVGAGATWLDPEIAKRAMEVIKDAYISNYEAEPVRAACGALSGREVEVLTLLCDGLANDAIAKCLSISRETVKTHVRHIMEKLQVGTRTEAAVRGIRLGLINDTRAIKGLTFSN